MTAILLCIALTSTCSRGGHAIPIPPRGGHAELVIETPVQVGRRISEERGLGGDEWACLYRLADRESGWTVQKYNRGGSGAYGIGQALPASKMAAFGADYMTSASTQVRWMLAYIEGRYGTPCAALAHSDAQGWY